MNKKLGLIFITLLLLVIPLTFAITGSVGSGKIYLKEQVFPDRDTQIQKTLRVINDNDFPVTITITPVEEMVDILDVLDNDFVLKANEEKDAKYVITLVRPGTYNGKILTMFKPTEGNGIAISTEIQVIAYGEGDFPSEEDTTNDNSDDTQNTTDDNSNTNQDNTQDTNDNTENNPSSDNTENNPSTTPSKNNIKTTDNAQPTGSATKGTNTKTTKTTSQIKPNPFYGAFLILAIIVLGLMIYFLLTKNTGSKAKWKN